MLHRQLPLLIVIIAVGHAAADEPLQWKLNPGQSLPLAIEQTYESTLHTGSGDVSSSSTQQVDLSWKANDGAEQVGAVRIEQEISRIRFGFNAPGGQGYEFDTDSSEPPQGLAAMIASLYRAMVENNAAFLLSARGDVSGFEPPEAVLESLKNLPGAAAAGEGADIYVQLLRPAVCQFPAGEVEPGQQWTATVGMPVATPGLGAATLTYSYRGEREVGGRTYAAIDVELTGFKPPEKSDQSIDIQVIESGGEVLFDREAGVVYSARLKSRFALAIKVGDEPTTGEATQSVVVEAGPVED
ncbi:hypothetical protein Pla123a_46570 [Posidoniimonas polymericola]|uniref:Uncharacterized protein n=1 Tax=Posidoniimonas polymericola TaxID=2528002 RepID=A0A5C5XVQ2_9BACT|nr:hypothetical protein [Posidoniimonas polymericola]TWT66768.1 hypothetical protein Pla123a_46570 [Posidoniimonas polymericola]